MEKQYIEVQPREQTGKNHNRRLRKEGLIPGIVYGGDRNAISISIPEKEVFDMLHAETGENTVRFLKMAGTDRKRSVMIKDYQMDPITHRILHADFIRVEADQEVTVQVPVKLVGTPVGVKIEGGMVDFIAREVELTVKVTEIPAEVEVDISELHIGDAVRLKDIDVAPALFTHAEDTVIVKVDEIRVHKLEIEEEEGELLEGEEMEAAEEGEEGGSKEKEEETEE